MNLNNLVVIHCYQNGAGDIDINKFEIEEAIRLIPGLEINSEKGTWSWKPKDVKEEIIGVPVHNSKINGYLGVYDKTRKDYTASVIDLREKYRGYQTGDCSEVAKELQGSDMVWW